MKKLLTVLTLSAFMAGASQAIISGLTAYWPLDSSTADAAHGLTNGAGNSTASTIDDSDGTFVSGASYNTTDPLFGSGAYFGDDTAGDSRLAKTNSVDTNGASNNLTVSWWGRVEPTGFDTTWQGGILTGEGNRWRFHRSGNSDTMAWQGGGGDISGAATVDDGAWHSMIGTSDAVGGRVLYIDGVNVATGPAATIDPASADLWIGNNPQSAGRAWDGSIDDVAIWNRALTQAEVTAIYDAGVAGNSLATLIPEPSTGMLGLLGLSILVARRRRR